MCIIPTGATYTFYERGNFFSSKTKNLEKKTMREKKRNRKRKEKAVVSPPRTPAGDVADTIYSVYTAVSNGYQVFILFYKISARYEGSYTATYKEGKTTAVRYIQGKYHFFSSSLFICPLCFCFLFDCFLSFPYFIECVCRGCRI